MKHVTLLIFGAFALISSTQGQQYSAEYLAGKISECTGMPSEQYKEYSTKLAKTLSMLSSEQLSRVFPHDSNGEQCALPQSLTLQVKSTANNNNTLNDLLKLRDISFGSSSSALSAPAKDELDIVFFHLLDHPEMSINIEGHATGPGSRQLSEDRAKSVRSYLVSLGIEPSRITAEGFGGAQPLKNLLPSDSRNQRIEIVPQ